MDHPTYHVISVSDKLFHALHDRFDDGYRFGHTGKMDGTDRLVTRGADGLIRGPDGEVIVRRSHWVKEIARLDPSFCQLKFESRDAQRTLEKVSAADWEFQRWEYAADGTPTTSVFKNTITGKKKRVRYRPTQRPKCCDHCGVQTLALKACGRCKAVYYCDVSHQKFAWETHKRVCAKLPFLPPEHTALLSTATLKTHSLHRMDVLQD